MPEASVLMAERKEETENGWQALLKRQLDIQAGDLPLRSDEMKIANARGGDPA